MNESASTYGKGSGAPWATTTDLGQVGEQGEGGLVSEWDVDDTVMSKCAQSIDNSGFLSSSWGRGRDKDAGIFTPVASGLPLLAGRIPECLPLRREISVAGGNAKQEAVVRLESIGGGERDIGVFGGRVHLGKHFLRECLRNSGLSGH